MKIHLAWIRITAAAAIATVGGQMAAGQGQYAPNTPAPQYSTTPYPTTAQYPATPQYSTAVPYGVQSTPPAQPTQQPAYASAPQRAYSAAPASRSRYAPVAQVPQPRPQYQPPAYQQPAGYPTYPALARKPDVAPAPHSADSLPTPGSTMNGANGVAMPPSHGQSVDGAHPGGNGGYSSPYPSTDGYYTSDPGCVNGSCDYGVGSYMQDDYAGDSVWFGGVYGLFMERSNPAYRRLTVGVDTSSYPFYPPASTTENDLNCRFLDYEYQPGVEVRFGCTFGIGSNCDYGCDTYDSCGYGGGCDTCNSCGYNGCQAPCCTTPTFAWEAVWWGLENDRNTQYVDGPVVGNFRYYGMVNYAGLSYDEDGGGTFDADETVNEFYNYQSPITSLGTYTVLSQRVRNNFWCQNLELNFLRLPMYCAGGCNTGCDPCGYDACAPSCGQPAFAIVGLCGVRYFRADDDFGFDTEWATATQPFFDGWGNGSNELFHDIQVENNLVGFQLGANMNYSVANRWNVFWDTNFGLYNNYITHYQSVYNPLGGSVEFVQEGREATVNSHKNDIAFLGEMRVGGAYNVTDSWRAVFAYRALAISGMALAPDQIRPEYSNWADTARINSEGSLILHGFQVGAECIY